MIVADALQAILVRRIAPPAASWLAAGTSAGGAFDRNTFLGRFTAAARRLGTEPLALANAETEALRAAGVDVPLTGWTLADLARVLLLVRVATTEPESVQVALVEEPYRCGDNRERVAVLRSLAFLPRPERFLAIALDGCRSSIQALFESIACENAYPAAHLPDLNFNQMVLKSLFTGVALARIVGLERRVTPELARMARDYASERAAAGRSIPADLWRLTGKGDR